MENQQVVKQQRPISARGLIWLFMLVNVACLLMTCQGIGFYSEWEKKGANITYPLDGEFTRTYRGVSYPKLHSVKRLSSNKFTSLITPLYGQTLEQYNANAPAFALAFNLPVSFDLAGNGFIRMRAGIQIPEAYDFQE